MTKRLGVVVIWSDGQHIRWGRIKSSSGMSPALEHGGGGHTSWHCRTCDAVVYGPPLAKHCTALEGPAAVWISTSQASPR